MPTLSNNELELTIRAVDKASAVLRQVSGATEGFGDKSEDASRKTDKLNTSAGKMGAVLGAVGGVVLSVVNRAFDEMGALIGGAVERVDTLNQFPKVLESMGISAAEAKATTDKLSKSLQGLPTPLQDGASGVQQFIAAGLSSGKATDTFLAMNNALLAAGGNAQDTGVVMDSLTRALSGGSTQATTIQAALSRMPTALQALQKATGLTADELYKLYAANPQRLADDLIELNKRGSSGLASLEEQARKATGGIATGMDNARTAVTRGLAGILQSVGTSNISSAISGVGVAFEQALGGVAQVVNFVKTNKTVFISLGAGIAVATAALVAASAAMKAYSAATLAVSAVMALQAQGLGVLRAAWLALNIAMNVSPLGWALTAVAALTSGIAFLAMSTGGMTEQERKANEERQRSIDLANQLRSAEESLTGARRDEEGAALRVEQAQRTYNETLARYGEESLEARTAAYDLKTAQDNLRTAQDQVKTATDQVTESVQAQKREMDILNERLNNMNGKSFTYYINGVEHVAQDYGKHGKYVTPTFASGTDYAPGGLAVVGDNPDGSWNSTTELVDLPRGSKVYSNRKSRELISRSQSGGATINVTNNNYNQLDYDKGITKLGFMLRGAAA
ncbi:tape measure protein [Mycolicibacterium sp. PDY-3]|uniref:tape measure protein n=1 Tax=Mycolicibacterium sp. PDY-3 TaxID=3376069 RepID=UPI0037ABBD27